MNEGSGPRVLGVGRRVSGVGEAALVQRSACTSCGSPFEINNFTEMCNGSEAGSYVRLIDFVYHSTLGLRVITRERERERERESARAVLEPFKQHLRPVSVWRQGAGTMGFRVCCLRFRGWGV